MNRLALTFSFLISISGISQKTTWGIMGGFTKSFEYTAQNKANPYFKFNPEKTLYRTFRPTYGFYANYKFTNSSSIDFELKKLTIIKSAKQDSLGNPTLQNVFATIHNLNISICHVYAIKENLKVSVGLSDNIFLIYGLNRISLPTFATNLEYSKNTIGVLTKLYIKYHGLNIEAGIMLPFTPSLRSISTAYYIPTSFIQTKIQLSSVSKFVNKMKKKF